MKKAFKYSIPSLDLWTILMASYLLCMFHLKYFVRLQQIIIWGMVLGYLLYNNKYIIGLFKTSRTGNFIQVTALIGVPYLLLSIYPIIVTRDLGYLSSIISMMILILYLLAIYVRLQKKYPKDNTMVLFEYLYVYVICLYVIISTIMINVPQVKDRILAYLDISSYESKMISNPYYATRIGWAGFSGYNTSMKCTLASCFLLNIIVNKKKGKSHIPEYIMLAICILGNLYYARAGLTITIVCICITLCYISIIQHKFMKFCWYTIIVGTAAVVSVNYIMKQAESNLSLQWAAELLINLTEGKGTEVSSLSKLQDMYFMPSIQTILFGDGRYSGAGEGYYMNTDAGLMRGILYFGIFGVVAVYAMMINNIVKIKKQTVIDNKLLSMLLLVVFIGFEIKGESIFLLIPVTFVLNLIKNHDYTRSVTLRAG